MAGLMQWFQVTCPKCTGALQVRLPEGVTSVQCSQCKAVFAVQVQPVALAPPGGPTPPVKRSRKRKKDTGMGDDAGAPKTLSAYNVFMKTEVAKVKAEHPSLPHREAFKLAAERWQASPMNPQNGGERFPQQLADKGGALTMVPTTVSGAAGGDGAGFAPGDVPGGAGSMATETATGGAANEGEEEDDGEDGDDDGGAE